MRNSKQKDVTFKLQSAEKTPTLFASASGGAIEKCRHGYKSISAILLSLAPKAYGCFLAENLETAAKCEHHIRTLRMSRYPSRFCLIYRRRDLWGSILLGRKGCNHINDSFPRYGVRAGDRKQIAVFCPIYRY